MGEGEVKSQRFYQIYHPEMLAQDELDPFNAQKKKRARIVWIKDSFQEEELPFPSRQKIFSTGYKKK